MPKHGESTFFKKWFKNAGSGGAGWVEATQVVAFWILATHLLSGQVPVAVSSHENQPAYAPQIAEAKATGGDSGSKDCMQTFVEEPFREVAFNRTHR